MKQILITLLLVLIPSCRDYNKLNYCIANKEYLKVCQNDPTSTWIWEAISCCESEINYNYFKNQEVNNEK
jgi:hypothetical protein